MEKVEILKVQNYLRKLFGVQHISLRKSTVNDLVEVLLNNEFVGTLCKDTDEGEVSYAFTMSILDFDLE